MKQLIGIVKAIKSKNTASVEITRRWTHPLYKKTITKRKNYLTDCKITVKPGQKVVIQECKPVSKKKRWQLVKTI